jgi:hypothetical protein
MSGIVTISSRTATKHVLSKSKITMVEFYQPQKGQSFGKVFFEDKSIFQFEIPKDGNAASYFEDKFF